MGNRKKQNTVPASIKWRKWGFNQGLADAYNDKSVAIDKHDLLFHVNRLWVLRLQSSGMPKHLLSPYYAAARGYIQGYYRAGIIPQEDFMLIPTNKTVGVIISMQMDEKLAYKQLIQLAKLPLHQIICIVSGSNEQLTQVIRQSSAIAQIYNNEPHIPESSRTVGARLAKSDILLFLDGKSVVPAKKLLPYLMEITNGADIVLNDNGLKAQVKPFYQRNMLEVTNEFINYCLGRPELGSSSLEETPHAMTRSACELINPSNLVVPSQAYMMAMLRGLDIRLVRTNYAKIKVKDSQIPPFNRELHDQMEALRLLIQARGNRLQFEDILRMREYAKESI
ncbi:hypothetical protein E0485_21490 [Paenibacillus albiflavus]|uniref:Glycosyltransferase n=1 Tax=Paenibacillus albiflavus TaxID=2545760 RepID=A0A4R4E1B2_9BACL|nr:hypothetical protein [Paenibacillus albiflavus]TCZ73196.1 hypothetical protein E0485_21490 [Paenibacillus albiflavus]